MIASFAYQYDLAGHILTETDLGGRVDTYTYDNLYRLTQQSISDASLGARTLTWTYDLVGNRVASTDSGAPSGQQSLTYVYNANDELTSITGTGGYGQTYTYDANGSTLTVTGTGGAASSTSTWTPTGMLATYTSGSTSVSYSYDDAGNRLTETVNGSTTTFLNDPLQAYDQVLEQYANSGLAATFVRGINIIFQDRGGSRSTYASDNLGSTRALTNSAGAITDTVTYDAYGNIIGGTQVTPNEFLFTGQQFDAAVGQYYQRARYYDASAGRFTSRDSYDGRMRYPITLNHYIYVGADPVERTDPSGRSWGGIAVLVSVSIIAVLSVYYALSKIFPRTFHWNSWSAAWQGPGLIRSYEKQNLAKIESAGTYKDADMRALFSAYSRIYPTVTSRECHVALEGLDSDLKKVVAANQAMRVGIKFVNADLVIQGQSEPDNIMVLVPSKFDKMSEYSKMGNPMWYDTEEKRNILFFYPGSLPIHPVDTLYNAIQNGSMSAGNPVRVLNIPEESF